MQVSIPPAREPVLLAVLCGAHTSGRPAPSPQPWPWDGTFLGAELAFPLTPQTSPQQQAPDFTPESDFHGTFLNALKSWALCPPFHVKTKLGFFQPPSLLSFCISPACTSLCVRAFHTPRAPTRVHAPTRTRTDTRVGDLPPGQVGGGGGARRR